MPKKVQIKLLSPSGELLNVVTCYAGQITVFRAQSTADLRPYQRALSGISGKERISVSVDGTEYNTEDHNLIGLGEVPPHAGLTIKGYFTRCGVSEENANALIQSFGISTSIDTPCNALTSDEDRRIRLLAATCEPSRVLILNEPFEHITSQWREPFSQLLTNFARQRNGLVIVTALSYRPETWIDNDTIARTQVGETIQRTIGFGAANSKSNDLMNQLRDAVRADAMAENTTPQPNASIHPAIPIAAATSLLTSASATGSINTVESASAFDHSESWMLNLKALAKRYSHIPGRELTYGIGLASVGIVCAVVSYGMASKGPDTPPMPVQSAPTNSVEPSSASISSGSTSSPAEIKEPATASVATLNEPPPPSKPSILDGYPSSVRVSLLDTARGTLAAMPANVAPQPESNKVAKSDDSGNLFRLLESASSKVDERRGSASQPDADSGEEQQNWHAPPTDESSEVDATEEQQRREAIRQKFLEAIRAAAEKRQASMDDNGT